MKFDKRTNRALFLSLLFLNITIRLVLHGIHEEGSDSFLIHNFAVSITEFGHAKWIIHPLSYFGLTPLSYPCAVPYLLSGISQLAGIDMETSILVLSLMTAVVGLVSSYLMAMEIKRDHVFAYSVAFIFSLSPIFVELTTWQATTRSLFIAFLPLLIWILLRTHGDRPDKYTSMFIAIIIFIVLGTIHHMFLMLPLFLIAYFSSVFIHNFVRKKTAKDHWLYRNQTIIMTAAFLIFFLPQFTHQGIYSTVSWQSYKTGLFFSGEEKYIIFLNMMVDYWSRAGFFAFLGIIGLAVLFYRPRKRINNIMKRYLHEKSYGEIFIIMCLLITIPFVTMGIYVSLIFLPFFSIMIAYGLINILKILKRNKHLLRVFIVTFLIISLGFTGFMVNHWNIRITSQPMTEETYSAGIYIKHHFDNSSVSNNGLMANRLSSISGLPCLPLGGAHAAWYPPELLIYNFANVEDYTFDRLSFDVVILTQSDFLYTTKYGVNAKEDWLNLMKEGVDDKSNTRTFNRYNIDFAVEYIPEEDQYFFWYLRYSIFFISMDNSKYILYSNGEHRIYLI